MSNTSKTDKFYNQLMELVEQSLETVLHSGVETYGDCDLERETANSKELLEKFRDKTKEDIQELRELSEWKIFSIAFYGETNAGKSTLIETLRILLGDQKKLDTQRKFQDMLKELHIEPERFAALEQSIEQLQGQLTKNQLHINQLEHDLLGEEREHIARLEVLRSTIAYKLNHLNLWQKLLHLFMKLNEEKALVVQELAFAQIQASSKVKLEATAIESHQIQAKLDAQKSELSKMESLLEQLRPLQDGCIIGDGRPDFTLHSNAYLFNVGEQQFQLIDVPGIEGAEMEVMDAIDASVKRAHAVFYVTRDATPPGSGSDGKEGTIDKIKRQLGKQTEVWAIFNKAVTNPRTLQGATLITQNDSVGLTEMNSLLTTSLGGEIYKGHHCVSGMPAFHATASCLLHNNPRTRDKKKFLDVMSGDDILERSGMNAFLHFLRTDLCKNFQIKIRDANLKKIRSCLQDGIDHMNLARNNFVNAEKKLQDQWKSASSQLDQLLSSTSSDLKRECHDKLADKQKEMRTAIYNYIDSDRDNDDFKTYLTNEIETFGTSVGQDLEKSFDKVLQSFTDKAKAIVEKNQNNVNEILHYMVDSPFSSLRLGFSTNFKMENGINIQGVLSSLGGAAALIWGAFFASNPVGWTVATVLGIAGLVFSFYKAVRGFFSSDYRKEQQRKSADENLNKVFEKLREMLDQNIESASEKIKAALDETKKQMGIPYQQSVNTKEALGKIIANMRNLSDKLI